MNKFVNDYAKSGTARFHMPGHKGRKFHGLEALDITEIRGADYLFEAEGIIAQSEAKMSAAYGSRRTFYSAEGSSLCIKAMLGIVSRSAKGKRITVAAPRNVHKAFINACILLDIDVEWIYPKGEFTSICAGSVTPEDVEKVLAKTEVDCVYVTSPDYLGNLSDIGGMSKVCRKYGVPLLCDNAHGAYLKFLSESLHPMDLGADMCCDSAHKTLPCYTGGAMLHISSHAPEEYDGYAKEIMSMFGSTSPSYLIMESLDLCADYVSGDFPRDLERTIKRVTACKERICSSGWQAVGDEPMKITIAAYKSGITGDELADRLREYDIEPEYSDTQYVVLMPSPFNSEEDYKKLEKEFSEIRQPRIRLFGDFPAIPKGIKRIGIRQAAFSAQHTVNVEDACGLVCGMTVTSCQPSVPVAVSGEEITPQVIKILKNYGIDRINVL